MNRGSYMNVNVSLNLLNKRRKRDRTPGLQSHLSLFCYVLNKFNNTEHIFFLNIILR